MGFVIFVVLGVVGLMLPRHPKFSGCPKCLKAMNPKATRCAVCGADVKPITLTTDKKGRGVPYQG